MIELASKYLLFHGAIVVTLGLLSGAPMGRAIVKKKGEDTVRAWRVAHSGLVMAGLMMLVIAVIIPYLKVGQLATWVLVWSYIISGYGFAVALPIGAWRGHRGLTSKPPGINRVVYGGNMIGALGSLIGTLILIYGAFKAL